MRTIERLLDHGPRKQRPRRIVVHGMGHQILTDEGEALYAASFLDRLGWSAHRLAAPDGTVIVCRHDEQGAWHARGFNDDSLGIEVLVDGIHNYSTFLEAIDTDWVTDEQFEAAVCTVADWCRRWGIPPVPGHLDRHSDVDPERKVDPGRGFDWERFVDRVRRDIESQR